MHGLQNYGNDEQVFDGNAYTISATYHCGAGLLQLYTHHPTAPAMPGGRPEYHMTPLKDYILTNNGETFLEGVTAFRNLRDKAKAYRDEFIQRANRIAQPSSS